MYQKLGFGSKINHLAALIHGHTRTQGCFLNLVPGYVYAAVHTNTYIHVKS
jgi:hypothetical protein